MAESVDALVSNTSGATRAGSTPALGTKKPLNLSIRRFFFFWGDSDESSSQELKEVKGSQRPIPSSANNSLTYQLINSYTIPSPPHAFQYRLQGGRHGRFLSAESSQRYPSPLQPRQTRCIVRRDVECLQRLSR